MNVLIDTEPLYSYPQGGIPVYTLNLIRSLSEIDQSLQLHSTYATIRSNKINGIRRTIKVNHLNVKLAQIHLPGRVSAWCPLLSEWLSTPRLPTLDLIHGTSHVPPLNLRRSKRCPLIITIHDLCSLRHPGKNYVLNCHATNMRYIQKYISEATAILSVSHFTKKELVDLLNIPESKIYVTHIGTQFCNNEFIIPDGQASAFLSSHRLTRDHFFLSTGTISPRKNYDTLLDAFAIYSLHEKESKLVIVGNYGWNSNNLIRRISLMHDRVIWLQNATVQELSILYRHASGFFMISHYEGFGIPLLEAMTLGCPVCYAIGSSMDEVVGEAGIKLLATDIDAVINAFNIFSCNTTLCADFIQKGYVRAKFFSWKNCAEKTLQVYKNVLNTG